MAAPVEAKVQASTAASFAAGLALWALGKYVFNGDVPDVWVSWIYAVVPAVLAFVGGYLAKHTHRPDLPTTPVVLDTTPLARVEFPTPPPPVAPTK